MTDIENKLKEFFISCENLGENSQNNLNGWFTSSYNCVGNNPVINCQYIKNGIVVVLVIKNLNTDTYYGSKWEGDVNNRKQLKISPSTAKELWLTFSPVAKKMNNN